MESLTKENFWNDLYAAYPSEMDVFCKWIDEYKKKVNWDALFINKWPNGVSKREPDIKYHDLPIAMQLGIFAQFVAEQEQEDTSSTAIEYIKEYFSEQAQFRKEEQAAGENFE